MLVRITCVLLLAGGNLPAPQMVMGAEQKPMDGISLLGALQQCRPDMPRTQYFEIKGQHSLYHNAWFLSGDDHRLPWQFVPPTGPRPEVELTLYDLRTDFSQSRDVSDAHPQRFAAMQSLWLQIAEANNVFPLDHRFGAVRARSVIRRSGRTRFEYRGTGISVPANVEPRLSGHNFTVTAQILRERPDESGVIAALGSKFGGWSLHLVDGKPAFAWAGSTDPAEMASAMASQPLPAGVTEIRMRFTTAGRDGPGNVIVQAAGREFLSLDVPHSVIRPAGGGETFDIGFDRGVG